jgi:hypothetical protein
MRRAQDRAAFQLRKRQQVSQALAEKVLEVGGLVGHWLLSRKEEEHARFRSSGIRFKVATIIAVQHDTVCELVG